MIRSTAQISFSELYIERTTRRSEFFKRLNTLIQWEGMEKEIRKMYQKGQGIKGQPAYSGLSLFKMLLLSQWYDLSDVGTEELVKESLSCMRFCGFRLEDQIPDHSTLCRFRNEIVAQKGYERLLKEINKQLEKHQVIVKTGVIVDASLTESPFAPKGAPTYVVEDRKEEGDNHMTQRKAGAKKEAQSGVDTQGKWLKKGGKLYYGYKKHIGVDKNGMIRVVHSTRANEHDSRGLIPLLSKLGSSSLKEVYADKGYQVPSNVGYLEKRDIKDRIQKKAYRNRPLSRIAILFNKLVSKTRWVVERTFGSIKRWFGSGKARYKGLARVHAQHLMQAIAHNLYRAPGIIMRCS